MTHTYTILRKPDGDWLLREIIGTSDFEPLTIPLGTFKDKLGADKALERALDPQEFKYDEVGNLID